MIQTLIVDKLTYLPWCYLDEAIIDNNYKAGERSLGTNLFDFFFQNPLEYQNFHRLMKSISAPVLQVVSQRYDFSKFKTVVDVGGSTGHLVKKILKDFPTIEKGINFDLAGVIQALKKEDPDKETVDLGERLELVAGDFFEAMVPGGDCYLLKYILHDWPEDKGELILRNIVAAMNPGARIMIIETVMPDFGVKHDAFTQFLDIEMMVVLNSKEKRKDEWEELFNKVGLVSLNYIQLDKTMHIIETKRK